ncbi:MAG: hypothetical protein K9J25_06135 [Bacteroidales bacterium]|nr:hypothetical protein [Bacteroidales bacterium]
MQYCFYSSLLPAKTGKWKGIDVWSAGSPQSGDKTGEFLVVSLRQDSLAVKVADINDIKSLRE